MSSLTSFSFCFIFFKIERSPILFYDIYTFTLAIARSLGDQFHNCWCAEPTLGSRVADVRL